MGAQTRLVTQSPPRPAQTVDQQPESDWCQGENDMLTLQKSTFLDTGKKRAENPNGLVFY